MLCLSYSGMNTTTGIDTACTAIYTCDSDADFDPWIPGYTLKG